MMYAIGDHVQYKNIHGPIRFICEDYMTVQVNNPKHKAYECRVVVPLCDWNKLEIYGEK
jgi:hypothetical protein